MKKIFGFVVLIFLLCCCSCKKTPNDENTPPKEIVSISTENSDNIRVLLNSEYHFEGVKVVAHYNDNTKEDVTTKATFSSISTAIVGKYEVEVSYQALTTKFYVEVFALPENLSIDTTAVKTTYTLSEKVDLTGLIVHFDNKIVYNYQITLYNEEGKALSTNTVFGKTGIYTVEISYNQESKYFSLLVINDEYAAVRNIDFTSLEEKYLTQGNTSAEIQEEVIVEDDLLSMSIHGGRIQSLADPVNYNDVAFTNHLSMQPQLGYFEFSITQKCDFTVLTANDGKAAFSLYSRTSGEPLSLFSNHEAGLDKYQMVLNPGDYIFECMFDEGILYAFSFNFYQINQVTTYKSMSVNVTAVKQIYHVGDSLDLTGIKIYLLTEDERLIRLFLDNCEVVILKDGLAQLRLDTIGTYQIKIVYRSLYQLLEKTFDIEVI